MSLCIAIPVYTKSEANTSEHWALKHKRRKDQKELVRLYFNRYKAQISLPCHIKLTRYGPRRLDSDNLPVSMKYIRDEIADILLPGLAPGRADGGDEFTWDYSQEKSGLYSVKVEITPRDKNVTQ